MKTLSLDDIKEILRIEVRKQIKHTQPYYLGTNVFDEEQTIQSLEIVSSRETKMKEELYGENIKEYENKLGKKLEGILTSRRFRICLSFHWSQTVYISNSIQTTHWKEMKINI